MSGDFAWPTEHGQETYEKYAGKWIAVLQSEIIGVGETATVAAEQADLRRPGADYILERIDLEPDRV